VTLHPQAKQLIEQMAALGSLHDLPIEDARALVEATAGMSGPGEDVKAVEDTTIPGPGGPLPVRIYRPGRAGPLPVIVDFHGGGWTYGSVELDDHLCRGLANAVGALVVSVGYRLAPEHRFPAAADDAHAATVWVQANVADLGGDPRRVAVLGESAGGSLAAATALRFRDEGRDPLALQVLVYPTLDSTMASNSWEMYGEGYFLTADAMAYAWREYAADAREHPYASPMHAADLSGVAPALLITAECDPTRGEGERYADRLRQAGVGVEAVSYAGMIHGFVGMGAIFEDAKLAVDEIVTALRAAFAGQPTPGGSASCR
jgi:acetyl esterase